LLFMTSTPISYGSGVLDRYTDFVFPASEPRTIDVWRPPGYAEATDVRYPVLYMHDGQNPFDPAPAYGGVDWGIDEAALRLVQQDGHPGVIVWPAGGDPLVDNLAARLPKPGRHKLCFDYGTATLDALYEPFQQRMDGHLAAAGYTRGVDWMTLKFDGAEHNEGAWRARVDAPLHFLLGAGSGRAV
jgi:hypothetical protein